MKVEERSIRDSVNSLVQEARFLSPVLFSITIVCVAGFIRALVTASVTVR